MHNLTLGKLTIAPMKMRNAELVVLIDWQLTEPGKRWRLTLSNKRVWVPLFQEPTRRGKYWAFYGIGNERGASPNHYGIDTIIEPEDKPFIP